MLNASETLKTEFFKFHNIATDIKSVNMYKEKFLLVLRKSGDESRGVFLLARVAAELKKHVVYSVNIKISTSHHPVAIYSGQAMVQMHKC